jgi:hypothetical protein
MKTAFRIVLCTIAFLVIFSCKKDPEVVPVKDPAEEQIIPDSTVAKVYGNVELVFVPMVGNKPLYMDSSYTSKLNEQFALHAFSFFVHNLAVNNFEGKEKPLISDIQSGVYLIDFTRPNFDAGHGLQSIRIKLETDTGKYSGMSFDIGVSRELNNSDPTLAPAPLDSATHKGLYWGWDTGYIFMFIEGSGADVYNNKFHLTMGKRQGIIPFTYGGFGPSRFRVEEGKTTRIFISIDFLEILTNQDGSGYTLSESSTANVHGGPNSLIIRNNTIKALEHISTQQ